jgi:hypothetical protein
MIPATPKPEAPDFQAGRTYVLILKEKRSDRRVLITSEWVRGDPGGVREPVGERSLSYVTSTQHGMARLEKDAARDFAGKSERMRDPVARALPCTFETVWYRRADRGFSLKAYDASGTLTVAADTIAFRGGGRTLLIPARDVHASTYAGFVSALPDPNV